MTTYLLAGGGTAGHVNPLLAVADRLRESSPDARIIVLGTNEGLEARLVPQRGYELVAIERLPFPRRPGLALLKFPGRLLAIIRSIRQLIEERGVDVVVGVGGYVSAPAYLAARRARVPIALHEANARPGMANRLGSLLTRHVGVAFKGTPLRHAKWVGMPLRLEIETLDRESLRAEALKHFGLESSRPTLLVTGGSLGALRINQTIRASSDALIDGGWQVLHITGSRDSAPASVREHHVTLEYCDRMDLALAAADLALARAGSATVSELTALGVAAVYVPLAIGNGEQRLNARQAVEAGAAIMVSDDEFTSEWISNILIPVMGDRSELARMGLKACEIGVLDGTERMVELVERAIAHQRAR